MANPFDEVGEEKKVEKKIKSKEEISFTFNKRSLERMAFIIIILVLAGLVFFNPFHQGCSVDANGNTVLEAKKEVKVAAVEEPKEETVVEKKEPVKEEEPEEEEVPVVTTDNPTSEKLLIGNNFEFEITDVKTGKNEDGKPVKIESVTIKIVNNWRDLSPKLVFRWYDDQSNEVIKEKDRSTFQFSTIAKGKTETVTRNTFDSKYFDPSDEDQEIVEVRLYDSKTDEYLARAKYTV